MRTARKAHHLRKKPYIRRRLASVKTPVQKGGLVGAAASALADYTAEYTKNYSTYKTDANGYVQKNDGYKSWQDRVDHDPDTVKCVLM